MLSNSKRKSPYQGLKPERWEAKTRNLVAAYPLKSAEIVEVVLKAWGEVFTSKIGAKPFRIGVHIFPSPQIMAFLLHELIPLELMDRYSGVWRRGQEAEEKDMVYIPDDFYSAEIKASSSSSQIYGNRSFAQKSKGAKKSKAGYYLAINFEKFSQISTMPKIAKIRFGWLDHEDWIGQQSPTGQQAHLSREADHYKLLSIY